MSSPRQSLNDPMKILATAKVETVAMSDEDSKGVEYPKLPSTAQETADKWGFFLHEIPNDGNCLFRAISHQIQLKSKAFPKQHREHSHLTLRKLAVDHLRLNEDVYKSFVAQSVPHNAPISPNYFSEYLLKMARPDYWGDHLTILALMAELKFSIAILIADQSGPPIILKSPDPRPVANLYIIHTNLFTHYQSTRVKDVSRVRETIDGIINESEAQETLLFATSLPEDELEESYDSEEEMSEADEAAAEMDDDLETDLVERFATMAQIADVKIALEDLADVMTIHHISDIDVYLMRNDWETAEAILLSDPSLISQVDVNSHTPFYKTAMIGNYDIINSLVAYSGFITLPPARKAYGLIDAAKGAVARGDVLLEQDPKNSVNAYEIARKYVAAAIEQEDSQYSRRLLRMILLKLSDALREYTVFLENNNKLVEAVQVATKVVALCSNDLKTDKAVLSIFKEKITELETKLQRQIPTLPPPPARFFSPKRSGRASNNRNLVVSTTGVTASSNYTTSAETTDSTQRKRNRGSG